MGNGFDLQRRLSYCSPAWVWAGWCWPVDQSFRSGPDLLPRQRRHRLLEGAGEVGDVMEGFVRDRLGDEAGVAGRATDDDDPGVVVLHRQPSIVLGPADLTDVPGFQHPAAGDAARARDGATAIGIGLPHVDHVHNTAKGEDVTKAGGF